MRIESGLHVVTAPNPGIMTGSGTNQYVLGRERLAIIDVAIGDGPNLEAAEAEIRAIGGRLERILVTHIHPDHLGGVAGFARHFGAEIGMHASRSGYGGIEADFTYEDGDRIEGDGWALDVVHTPGHESGHCCFFEPERRWLFTGDHVVGEGTVVIAPPDGDMAAYIDSLERLHELPARILMGGHGPVIDDPKARIREYIDHRLERERQILGVLGEERTIPEIVAIVYRETPTFLHQIAEMSVQAHLLKLGAEGRVVETNGRYQVGT